MRKNIVVVGSANMDMVTKARDFPRPGETIFGSTFGMFPGGKGANQAVCAAKLGGTVSFVGKIGNDVLGRRLADNMERQGVDLKHLMTDKRLSTGIALILVDARGQNQIIVVSGSNMNVAAGEVKKCRQLFSNAAVVLAQLENPLPAVVAAMQLGKKRGAITILNPAPAKKLPGNLFRYIDFLTPNERELEILAARSVSTEKSLPIAARRLVEAGARNVITTLGERGCVLVNASRVKKFPALRVKAVDTTAAGDAFNGALAVSLARGMTIDASIEFAQRVAAFSVTRMGAQPSMPTLRELMTWKGGRQG